MIATVPSPLAVADMITTALAMLLWAVSVRHDGLEAIVFSGCHFYDDSLLRIA